MTFIEKDECCVPHTLLVKYGAYEEKNASNNVKRRLTSLVENKLISSESFKLLHVEELGENNKTYHRDIYYLHPNIFEIMLMRSKCNIVYCQYYILLNKSVKYYHNYQDMYKEYIISQKDDKIDSLTKKIDELLNDSKNTKEELKETRERLSDVEDDLYDTKVDLSVVQDKLEISVEDRAVKPINTSKINKICILKNKEDPSMYYLTCGENFTYVKFKQRDSITRVIKRKSDYEVIDTIDNVPNSIYLFDHIKNELNNKAKAFKRVVKLIRINQEEFIDIIKSIFDGRRNIDLSKKPN